MKGRKRGSNGPFREIKGFEFDNVIIKAEDIELEESPQAQPRNEDEYYKHLFHQAALAIHTARIQSNSEYMDFNESVREAKTLIVAIKAL